MMDDFVWRGAEVFDQHAKSWCGACYLVAVVQVVEDRGNLLLRGARHHVDLQTVLDHFEDAEREEGWNACHGGIPMEVVDCLAARTCPLRTSTTETTRWLGYPMHTTRTPLSDAPFVVTGGERLPAARVADEVRAHGPVVLEVDADTLKSVDAHGVVTTDAYAEPNHAVAVLGRKTVRGVACWVIRNSWGTRRVPREIPDDLSCVAHGENACEVRWEYWVGDPSNPGHCYLPVSHPCALVDDPWIAPRVALRVALRA